MAVPPCNNQLADMHVDVECPIRLELPAGENLSFGGAISTSRNHGVGGSILGGQVASARDTRIINVNQC